MSAASANTVLYRTSTLGTSNNNQLYIIGRESRDTSARYQIPVIYLRFPYRCSQRPRTRSMVICLLPNDKEYVVLPFEFSRSEIRANPVPDIAPRAPLRAELLPTFSNHPWTYCSYFFPTTAKSMTWISRVFPSSTTPVTLRALVIVLLMLVWGYGTSGR